MMSSSSKPQKGADMEKISKDVIWMNTEKAVKSEANRMKDKLHEVREKYRRANAADNKECNKLFIEWNEELLSFCKANRRNYHMESRTEKLDRQMLEDQMIIAQKEEEIEKLRTDLIEEKDGKDEALNRLSELQSHLLKFGNPEITDLGDKNRPTNLGEKYKELYDNEWTDTFEFLTEQNEKKDEEAIEILYDMLKSCSELCSKSVRKQYKTLAGLVTDPLHVRATSAKPAIPGKEIKTNTDVKENLSKTLPAGTSTEIMAGNKELSKTAHIQAVYEVQPACGTTKPDTDEDIIQGKVEVAVKEFSKSIAEESLKNVAVTDMLPVMKKGEQLTEAILQNDNVKEYLEKSFKLSWLMQTQHPPMLIDFSKTSGSAFDTNVFDSYTSRGPKVEQIVWPPVFLHEGGPLVSKGVAQGTTVTTQ